MVTKTHQEYKNKGFLEDQREFFDKLITQDWDTYQLTEWDHTRRLEVAAIIGAIPTPRRILDVGCGCGFHDVIFAEYDAVDQVVGIDYSTKSIMQANLYYYHPKVERYVGDIFSYNELVTQHGKFDLVTSFQVIEHLKDPLAFLYACQEMIMENGFIAIVTPNKGKLINQFRRMIGLKNLMVDPLHYMEYSIKEITKMGEECGLSAVHTFAHSLSLPFINKTYRTSLGSFQSKWGDIIGVVFQQGKVCR